MQFSWLLTVQKEWHLESCPCVLHIYRANNTNASYTAASTHIVRHSNMPRSFIKPAFARTLTRARSFSRPTEQRLLDIWVSSRLFMTRFTWNMCFMGKLIGRRTYRQGRGEGRRNSLSRSLLLLTAADSFATSDRIIEWGVIWESARLPSCSLHPADTHRRRRTHTGSRLEVWCCLVVAQQHLLVKDTHRLESPRFLLHESTQA